MIGKYKTDFHARRMSQLFRNTSLRFSEVQGREERGRREDWVMFFGLLTEGKVVPWINALSRGDRFLAAVSAVSFVVRPLLRRFQAVGLSGNQLLITLHENNLLRQTFYVNGNLRFSRVSKVNNESAESLAASVKKELERTLQYLASLKTLLKMEFPFNLSLPVRWSVSYGRFLKVEIAFVSLFMMWRIWLGKKV